MGNIIMMYILEEFAKKMGWTVLERPENFFAATFGDVQVYCGKTPGFTTWHYGHCPANSTSSSLGSENEFVGELIKNEAFVNTLLFISKIVMQNGELIFGLQGQPVAAGELIPL